MLALEHAYNIHTGRINDCTGNWRLRKEHELTRDEKKRYERILAFDHRDDGKRQVIVCHDCGAGYPATPENRLAAIDENYAGIYLQRRTAEGAAQIDSHRRDKA